ncbi:hypothetical protein D7147_27135 [Micromonospora musae]|uniref:Uncharacterized protein n=1 Tax=Micromonospora musae TaxID=1894970 RepID=A0A3A9YF91_9ACTN|nr:hypothetical protein [Micromonospora musae]RKN14954.1 hypothetical protein D7147_27135 [Micromonospora musae]RKN35483.1 hypothetical protein D7044_04820 [Micromonospora musae]
MVDELDRLGMLRADRLRLDEEELDLIDRARYAGATWAQIAVALGLASRQAAEQRRQRLATARLARRRELDRGFSDRLVALRAAVADLQRWIDVDQQWSGRFPGAALVRDTVAVSHDAEPGALHTLSRHIIDDLVRAGREHLPAPVQAVAARMETALSTND